MRPLRRGTNLSRVAGFNEAVVIDSIRRARQGLSRVEISEQTGLSPQTVSNITRRMLESELLREGTRVTSGKGKPRTPLRLNPRGRFALGVHLDPLITTIVLLNLRGDMVASVRWSTPVDDPPDQVLRQIADAIPSVLADAGVDRAAVAGIGFASPGPVDSVHGLVVDPPHLSAWRNVPVVQQLGDYTGLPVELDKDVIAALVGERWAGAAMGHSNATFLYLSTGIGLGVAVDDAVVRGLTGNAGDIGHLVVDDRGPLCYCGLRGCLGVTFSPSALVQLALREGAVAPEHADGVRSGDRAVIDLAFRELCDRMHDGDPAAHRVVEESVRPLAKAISTVANLFDTELLVLGGPTWTRCGDAYLDQLRRLVAPTIVRGAIGRPLEIVGTALGEDVIAVGAACLVLDNAFAPALSAIALED